MARNLLSRTLDCRNSWQLFHSQRQTSKESRNYSFMWSIINTSLSAKRHTTSFYLVMKVIAELFSLRIADRFMHSVAYRQLNYQHVLFFWEKTHHFIKLIKQPMHLPNNTPTAINLAVLQMAQASHFETSRYIEFAKTVFANKLQKHLKTGQLQ